MFTIYCSLKLQINAQENQKSETETYLEMKNNG